MKKLFIFLMAILLALTAPMAAMASAWGADVTVNACMYDLQITRYTAKRDSTGAVGYYAYAPDSAVQAGDYVHFLIALTIPAHKTMMDRYGIDPGQDGAQLQMTAAGIAPVDARGAVRASAMTAAIPAGGGAARTLYYAPDGSWRTTVSAAMWTAYVTSASSAAVSADISYDNGLKNITMQNGTNTYRLISDSSGYIAYDAGTRMRVSVTNTWLVTGASLSVGTGSYHRLYATRSGYAVEGDNAAGMWTGVAASYFEALGFSFDELYAGRVYMSPKNILAHFGPPAEISVSVTWPTSATAIGALPVSTVPATGTGPSLVITALALGILAFVFWPKRPRGKAA